MQKTDNIIEEEYARGYRLALMYKRSRISHGTRYDIEMDFRSDRQFIKEFLKIAPDASVIHRARIDVLMDRNKELYEQYKRAIDHTRQQPEDLEVIDKFTYSELIGYLAGIKDCLGTCSVDTGDSLYSVVKTTYGDKAKELLDLFKRIHPDFAIKTHSAKKAAERCIYYVVPTTEEASIFISQFGLLKMYKITYHYYEE